MLKQKDTAKRLMETRIIAMLSQEKKVSEKEAMSQFYNSVVYRWFIDDSCGIAREGADAVFYRVLGELDGDYFI